MYEYVVHTVALVIWMIAIAISLIATLGGMISSFVMAVVVPWSYFMAYEPMKAIGSLLVASLPLCIVGLALLHILHNFSIKLHTIYGTVG